jgi:hypothetical protein
MPLLRNVAVVAVAAALATAPAWADTVPANADSQVSFAQLAVKGGQLSYVTVKNAPPGGLFQGFVRFDLSAIPEGALVTRATLRAYVNYFSKPGRVLVLPVYGPWTEANLSGATAPPIGDPIASINLVSERLRSYVNADITQLVQDWVNGDVDNNGVALAGDPTNDVWVRFDSKENIQGSHPIELEVVLGDPVVNGAISDVFAGFGLDGGGSAGEIDLDVNPNEIQTRVGACSAGTAIQSVGVWGQPSCVDVGDIFGITTGAGSGLLGGAAAGTVNLSVDPNQYQRRLTTSCAANQKLVGVDGNGVPTCLPDADTVNPGTVTGVTAAPGSGLVVTNPNTTPSLNVDATIQRRTTLPVCPAGYALVSIGTDGTPTCQPLGTTVQIFPFQGPVADIAGSNAEYEFAGPTAAIVTTASQRVTATAEAPLGLDTGGPQTARVGICYQPAAGGTIANFVGADYSIHVIYVERHSYSAVATRVFVAGTWNVGMCVRNNLSETISNNDYVNGWVMVTN